MTSRDGICYLSYRRYRKLNAPWNNRIEETIGELENQVTIVIVTHNMQQAQRVAGNCAFFLAAENTPGAIVESGPTAQLFGSPADPRTADYGHGRFG